MKPTTQNIVKTLSCAAVIAGCLITTPIKAQEVVGYPPPEYVATSQPVYFEGHPAYFFNGRWCYRVGNGWGFYREEPPFLRDWRGHHAEPQRRLYEGHYEAHGRREGFRR